MRRTQINNNEIAARMNKALNLMPEIPKDRSRITAIAKLFTESNQTIRKWLIGDANKKTTLPYVSKLPEIAKILNVNVNWLLSGDGLMRPEGSQPAIIDISVLSEALEFASNELNIFSYDTLSFDEQAKVLGYLCDTLAGGTSGNTKENISLTVKYLLAK